jgi:hypothetical protein
MKTISKTIDAFDEMLRLLVLERGANFPAKDQRIEQIAENLIGAIPLVPPIHDRSAEILARVHEETEQLETFGTLLSSMRKQRNIDTPTLVEATKLSREQLELLARDELFPYRIPVVLMKCLIEYLGISFKKAQTALQRTAAFIIENSSAPNNTSVAPAFARRQSLIPSGINREAAIDTGEVVDSDFAQKALEIYLRRLEALFKTHN